LLEPLPLLTQCIIKRGPQLCVAPNPFYQQQQVVAARDQQAKEGEINPLAYRRLASARRCCCLSACGCKLLHGAGITVAAAPAAGACQCRTTKASCISCCCVCCKICGAKARHQRMRLHVVHRDQRQAVDG
jgi:hypothetical protein